MSSDWYRTFFHGLALDLWRMAVSPEQTSHDVDFAFERLDLAPGRRVLDAPCGNGRHALELAARGCRVRGIDIAEEFLAEARREAQSRRLDVEFVHGDIAALDARGCFDAALCLGNAFGYLEHDVTLDWLARTRDALVPGGGLLIESGAVAEALLPFLEPDLEYEFGGITMKDEHRYVAAESRVDATYTFMRGSTVQRGQSRQHVYTIAEVSRMLRGAGFEGIAVFGGDFGAPARAPFEFGHRCAWFVARRR